MLKHCEFKSHFLTHRRKCRHGSSGFRDMLPYQDSHPNKDWVPHPGEKNHWRQDIVEAGHNVVINIEDAVELYTQLPHLHAPAHRLLAWWKDFITLHLMTEARHPQRLQAKSRVFSGPWGTSPCRSALFFDALSVLMRHVRSLGWASPVLFHDK